MAVAIQLKGEVPTFLDCRKPVLSDAAGGVEGAFGLLAMTG